MAYKGMTHDEAERIVRAHLIDHLAALDLAEAVGFPANKSDLRGAARLRMAQNRMLTALQHANGEPATLVIRRPGRGRS